MCASASAARARDSASARAEELSFVAPAIGCVEDRQPQDSRTVEIVPDERRVHEYRKPLGVGPDELERHLPDLALHVQERSEMRFPVDPASRREQLDESLPHQQLAPFVAEPAQERLVDLDERPVRQRGHVAGRRMLVEVLCVLREQALLDEDPDLGRRTLGSVYRKLLIAAIVSSGALRFGQCPVASIWTNVPLRRCSWT